MRSPIPTQALAPMLFCKQDAISFFGIIPHPRADILQLYEIDRLLGPSSFIGITFAINSNMLRIFHVQSQFSTNRT